MKEKANIGLKKSVKKVNVFKIIFPQNRFFME
jgi:hypothetical protein